MTTSHLDSEVRRHQIVHTARKIVATNGMAWLTIQELAKEVGVSEGAIYRHFKSKDEILFVMVQDVEKNLLDAISDSAGPHVSAMSQLRHIFQRHFSAVERRNGASFAVLAESMHIADSQVKQAARDMVEHYLGLITTVIKRGIDQHEIDKNVDVKAAALLFFGMVQATVTLWSFNNRAHPLAQHSNSMWAIFRNGLAPRSEEI